MGWVDAKKAYDSTDHGWVKAMMLMHRFPTWLCRAIQNLSRSWSTRIVTTTRKGREVSDTTTHMYIEGSGAKFWGRPGASPSSPPAAHNFAPEPSIYMCVR